MAYQTVFKRYEIKYLLTQAQKDAVMAAMKSHMAPDKYGRTTIRNIYFDTENYRLIRRSIEKPAYKEKLRLRSYGCPVSGSPVFVELKKKYQDVVYKRRVALPLDAALTWVCDRTPRDEPTQITREIDYFMDFYERLRPAMFLCYDRQAYYAMDGSDFRITFDTDILCRQNDIRLDGEAPGTPILPPGLTLMEIKSPGSMPLWLAHTLTENKIYKTSFSKYGIAYQTLIFTPQEVSYHGSNL
ncbi:MAG: polyphosphate polymerase domain-containing protein [Oscillospiraceae bacterium]|nr:polyphosphate polymerase domain-containing protein [Oscillospiraceae bacterium]